MIPLTFFGFKVEEDAQGFTDEVFKVVGAMCVSSQEKAELPVYKLKVVNKNTKKPNSALHKIAKIRLSSSLV